MAVKWRWLRLSSTATTLQKLIEVLNERLKKLEDFLGGGGGAGDGLYAAEGFLYNAGNVLVAGESDWLDVPSDFTITNAELVGDVVGTLSVAVYASAYGSWNTWTLISASDPLTLAGTKKSQSFMTGWTRTLTGGHYLKFVITGTPTSVTKATATLTLSAPLGAGAASASPSGPAGGVLSGTYPNPTFAVDMATQAELDAVAAAKADITYVDAKVAGLSWKQAVRVATTAAGTLASSFANGSAVDGVTLATGNRILIKNQTTGSENGIYTVNASGAPTRATDADSGAELVNATCYVSEGATNADTQWTCSTNAPITVGSTALTFAQLSTGGSSLTARAYWMVLIDKIQNTSADNARVGELALRAISGGSNIATGGTPIFTDQFSSSGDNSASAAFDSNTATSWGSATTTRPNGIGYQLSSAQVVNEIVITARNDSFGPGGSATVFRIMSSADGVNWMLEWTCLSPATWTAGLSRTFTRPT